MISFIFGVLGSAIFWGIFFSASFVIGSVMLKYIAPLTWQYLKVGKRPKSKYWPTLDAEIFPMVIAAICIYLFWPVVLVCVVLGFVFSKIIWPIIKKSILSAGALVPDIEIKTK